MPVAFTRYLHALEEARGKEHARCCGRCSGVKRPETHAEVERLYQLDKAAPFGVDTDSPDSKQFTVTRLAAGATMLRDLWWTAWVTSASDSSDQRPPR